MAGCARCENFHGTATEVLEHQKTCVDQKWKAVVEAKEAQTFTKAKRLVREIYGIETKPMPPEAIAAKKASGVGNSVVARRIKQLEKEEIRELSKPSYNPKIRR